MVKLISVIFLFILAVSCGNIGVTPNGPVSVNPVSVNVQFDMTALQGYFTAVCKSQLSPANYPDTDSYNAAVTACANLQIGDFLDAFAAISGYTPTVTPSPSPSPSS